MTPTLRAHRQIRALGELRQDLAALLWPTQCVACGTPDRDCCRGCREELRERRDRVLHIRAPAGVNARVAGPYAGPLRAMLVAFKHQGRTGFARDLGDQLAAPLQAALQATLQSALQATSQAAPQATLPGSGGPVLLIAAASRATRVRERGYRHVEVIIRAALRNGPWPAGSSPRLLPRALQAAPGRTGQVGLDAAARLRNASLVRVRPCVRRTLTGARVILIDDVITTGATVSAACAALAAAGARVVGVVALCAVARKDA